MMKMTTIEKAVEEAQKRYEKGCMRAFLEGKKSARWIKGVLRTNNAYVRENLSELAQTYGDRPKFKELLAICHELGYI